MYDNQEKKCSISDNANYQEDIIILYYLLII
jgi:hypothetical protein